MYLFLPFCILRSKSNLFFRRESYFPPFFLAKLGRFKFSMEVAKQFENAERKRAEKASGGANSKSRKISEPAKKTPVNGGDTNGGGGLGGVGNSNSANQKNRKDSNVTKLPSIHVTNFNTQKTGSEKTASAAAAAAASFNVPSVIVSKKRKERPRRESPDKSAKLDYRRSFGNPDKFTRSISVPGPGPGMVGPIGKFLIITRCINGN